MTYKSAKHRCGGCIRCPQSSRHFLLLPPLGQRGCVAPRSAPGIALAVLQPTEELPSKGTFLTCLQRSKSPSQPPPGPAPSVPTSDLGAALPAAACEAERSLNPRAVMHHSFYVASICSLTAFHLESAWCCRQTIRPGRNAGQGASQGALCRLHIEHIQASHTAAHNIHGLLIFFITLAL